MGVLGDMLDATRLTAQTKQTQGPSEVTPPVPMPCRGEDVAATRARRRGKSPHMRDLGERDGEAMRRALRTHADAFDEVDYGPDLLVALVRSGPSRSLTPTDPVRAGHRSQDGAHRPWSASLPAAAATPRGRAENHAPLDHGDPSRGPSGYRGSFRDPPGLLLGP